MEGIETSGPVVGLNVKFVSVGAPTWRGLKLGALRRWYVSVLMSVGAPTWRGLKPDESIFHPTILRCQ